MAVASAAVTLAEAVATATRLTITSIIATTMK